MELKNEKEQIYELVARLNYYEKGLQAGKKIKKVECKLCSLSSRCAFCLASNYSGLGNCVLGISARHSIRSDISRPYRKRIIRKWQTELKRRANANLEAAGSKWRIEWEREE